MITDVLSAMPGVTHWRVELLHLCFLTFSTICNDCWAAHSPVVLFYCYINLNWHWPGGVTYSLTNLWWLLPDLYVLMMVEFLTICFTFLHVVTSLTNQSVVTWKPGLWHHASQAVL